MPRLHDVDTHQEIRGGMHGDAGSQAFAPDTEEIGQATVDEGSRVIGRRVCSHEQPRDDGIGEPTMAAEGLFPIVPFPIAHKAHEEPTPENFLNQGHHHGGSEKPEDQGKPVGGGMVKNPGVEAFLALGHSQRLQPTRRFTLEPPCVVKRSRQQPKPDTDRPKPNADERPLE